jgi:ComF family protein
VLEGGPADECPHCREHHFAFDAVAVLGRYEADLRLAVHRMKQPTGEALAEALGRTLAQHRAAQFSQFHPDCLVPVPMYWTRRLWRRTNDAEAIARGLAAVLAIPVLWRAVRRVRHTELQRDMRVDERMRNVRGAFAVARPAAVAGRRVLLVDDVFTSGATTGELARVLKKAGAEAVAVAVIARAQGLSAT